MHVNIVQPAPSAASAVSRTCARSAPGPPESVWLKKWTPTSTTPSLLGAHAEADVGETDGTPPGAFDLRWPHHGLGMLIPTAFASPQTWTKRENPSPNLDQSHRADPGRLRAPGDLTRRAAPSLEIDERQRSVTPNRGNESLITLPSQYKQQQRRTSFLWPRDCPRPRSGKEIGKHSRRHKGDQGAGTHHERLISIWEAAQSPVIRAAFASVHLCSLSADSC